MGLLRYKGFSSIPTLFKKIQSRREQLERFTPTFAEWASKNRIQIVRDGARTTSGATIIFTVESGDVLFITSAWFVTSTDGTDVFQIANLEITDESRTILRNIFEVRHNPAIRSDPIPISSSFPSPIRIEGGRNIEVTNQGANIVSSAGFVGWIEQKSLEIV